ncbi:MAG TPA: MFS transporter [Aliidongia sp.]|nr:MFS transporter [Aliidongia sp.]
MNSADDIGRRLDRLAISRAHIKLISLIAAGMFFDSFDIYIASGVLGAMVKSGESTLSLNATFLSVTFIGMMLGAWFSGILGDRFGRRFCYQFNLALYGGASIAGALAPSMSWLIFFRFFMGLGMGAEIVVGYGTLSEFIPARNRGRFGAILNLIINCSLFLSTFLGWLIIPAYGWRWMFAIAGAGAGLVWFLRKSMPESPRWLAAHGRIAEAERIVRDIEAQSTAVPPSTPAEPVQDIAASPGRFGELFSRPLLKRTITGITVLIALFTVNYAYVSWIPTFLVQQGHSVSSSLGLTTFMFAGGPLGSLIAMALSERLGRKWGLVLFSFVGIVLGIVYAFATTPVMLVAAGFSVTACIYVLSSLSVATYVPELFPTRLRLRGAGLSNAVGRGVNILMPYAVAAIFGAFGITGVVTLTGGILLLQAVIVGLIGAETRQRSLEDLAVEPSEPAGLVAKELS